MIVDVRNWWAIAPNTFDPSPEWLLVSVDPGCDRIEVMTVIFPGQATDFDTDDLILLKVFH